MMITTHTAYRQALSRIQELRSDGASAENGGELAVLDAAIAAYDALPGRPDESKGKPMPNPYDGDPTFSGKGPETAKRDEPSSSPAKPATY